MNADASIAALARAEVIALHAFFVAWFTGARPAPDFASCERAFAPEFRMVTPEGVAHDRAAIVARIRRACGAMPDGFNIAIHGVRPVWTCESAALLEYVEEQYREGRMTARLSTALFVREPSAPRGVVWRHLQETWMAAKDETNA